MYILINNRIKLFLIEKKIIDSKIMLIIDNKHTQVKIRSCEFKRIYKIIDGLWVFCSQNVYFSSVCFS